MPAVGPGVNRFPTDVQVAEFILPYGEAKMTALQADMASIFPTVGFVVTGVEFNYKVSMTCNKLHYEQAMTFIFPNKKPYETSGGKGY